MIGLYNFIMGSSAPLLRALLARRCRAGKEDPARLDERTGVAGLQRPSGSLIWFHGASVGESQSMLILIDALLARDPALNILVTTGTVTSAQLMKRRLPESAFHQYYPLDNPAWVARFLDHWRPDLAIWMESELWPAMLSALKAREIPAALVNARLSPRSFRRWKRAGTGIASLLSTFSACLTQTEEDAAFYRALGAGNVIVSDNLKYSAAPLPCDLTDLQDLRAATENRILWLYASTHNAEEEIACRLHVTLKDKIPNLLTIIAPRHPERRHDILAACEKYSLNMHLRGTEKALPEKEDQIYIADTMGELGLFYRLCPLACIGRTFSLDGGGGHNPIEAAQLGCAVLHGPHVQNLAQIFEDLGAAGGTIALKNEQDFLAMLETLLSDPEKLQAVQEKAQAFAREKAHVLETVMTALTPLLPRESLRSCA